MQIELSTDEAQLLWDALDNLFITYIESERLIPEYKYNEIRLLKQKLEDSDSKYQSISHWGLHKQT